MNLATISLRERGLIGDDALTGAGASLRADIEEATDRQLGAGPGRDRPGPDRHPAAAPGVVAADRRVTAGFPLTDAGAAEPARPAGVARHADDTVVMAASLASLDAGLAARRAHPSVNGSRVAPVSSTQTDLVSVYSRMASTPFSRPMPLAPNPPKGTCGATTR